ncbi:putative F-box domain-containing protein [Tanacetum coccineum]
MVMFDVVEAILSRCLVTDLLRCKSVCKSWYSLISTPFVKTHSKFICNKEEYNTSTRIAMINPWVSRCLCWSSVPVQWRDYNKWFLAGSSNGLVGLFSQHRICVTNPLTRVFRVFENPPKFPEGVSSQLCLGFGYNSCEDDYNVFMAITKGTHRARVHVLSLKSNIWKHFGQVNYRFHDGALAKPGILFNGALHWFWFDAIHTTHNKVLLVSFDLAREEFREIPQPNDAGYVWSFRSTLGIIKGRLCIFHKRRDDGLPYGIWVMKNYNSWELLPNDCEIKDHDIHYMLKDSIQSSILPTYYCDDNTRPSRDAEFIESPIFVQTLVSPYLNINGRPDLTENNGETKSR